MAIEFQPYFQDMWFENDIGELSSSVADADFLVHEIRNGKSSDIFDLRELELLTVGFRDLVPGFPNRSEANLRLQASNTQHLVNGNLDYGIIEKTGDSLYEVKFPIREGIVLPDLTLDLFYYYGLTSDGSNLSFSSSPADAETLSGIPNYSINFDMGQDGIDSDYPLLTSFDLDYSNLLVSQEFQSDEQIERIDLSGTVSDSSGVNHIMVWYDRIFENGTISEEILLLEELNNYSNTNGTFETIVENKLDEDLGALNDITLHYLTIVDSTGKASVYSMADEPRSQTGKVHLDLSDLEDVTPPLGSLYNPNDNIYGTISLNKSENYFSAEKDGLYNPALDYVRVDANPDTGGSTFKIGLSGINDAANYKQLIISLSDSNNNWIGASAGNYERDLSGDSYHAVITPLALEDTCEVSFEIPEGVILPNLSLVSANIEAQYRDGSWSGNPQDIALSSPIKIYPDLGDISDAPNINIIDFNIVYQNINSNETSATYVGQVDNVSDINHIWVEGVVQTYFDGSSIGLPSAFIMPSDISPDGTFAVTAEKSIYTPEVNLEDLNGPSISGATPYVNVVSNAGSSKFYAVAPDWENYPEHGFGVDQALTESDGDFKYQHFMIYDAANSDGGEISTFNLNKMYDTTGQFYGTPGQYFNFDIDHNDPVIEEQIIYSIQAEYSYGDDIDWLSISPSGSLEGYIPSDFTYGGGNIIAEWVDPSTAFTYGTTYQGFRITQPFEERSGPEIRIGNSWVNLNHALESPVYVNSTDTPLYFNDDTIDAHSIILSDGSSYLLSEYDAVRNGVGIEVHTSKNDDYINLSGYLASDFYGTDRDQMVDMTASPGNDIYIGPSFKNQDNEFSTILDLQEYFKYSEQLKLDASKGLEINILSDGIVKIIDSANDYKSTGYNIERVQTSEYSNDIVYGNAERNGFFSYGGADTFYGGGGLDYYEIGRDRDGPEDSGLTNKIIIAEYEYGEKIYIKEMGFSENFDEIGSVRFDKALNKTIISKKLENGELDDRIEINGFWEISEASSLEGQDKAELKLSPVFAPVDIDLDSYQKTQLGSDDDIFFGENAKDYVLTGGGNDVIKAGGDNDLIRVEGEGSVQVDTGEGSDHVSVGAGFSGTLLVKNGAGFNTLKIDQEIKNGGVSTSPYYSGNSDENGFEYTLADNSIITIENQFVFNEQTTQYEVADTGFQYFEYNGWKGFAEEFSGYNWRGLTGTQGDDLLKVHDHDDENIVNFLSGRDGNDELILAGGVNQAWGGEGDDTFKVMATDQRTIIIADRSAPPYYSGDFNGDELPEVFSRNVSFADVVEIDWSYTDSVIDTVAHGYRITNSELDAVVEVYDVEILKFANGDGTWDTRYLTNGAPVDKDSWMNGHAGKDIAYGDGSDVRFVLGNGTAPEGAALSDNGTSDILQVYANITTVTQQSYVYYQRGSAKRTSPAKGWARKTGKRDVESTEEALIWEGDRTAVDAFTFSDNVSINVINVADKSWNDAEIEYTLGTDGIDLIFGNDSDNLIDGKGGDDIIFGGDGEDVIIGGEGDDVLVGGAGDDIIRGDMIDDMDAAMTYFADLDDFDTDTLSIETSTVVEGNDVILGGDGIDDIESGEGKNLVASGRADMDGDGEADLDTIKEHMTAHKDIFEDDDWI